MGKRARVPERGGEGRDACAGDEDGGDGRAEGGDGAGDVAAQHGGEGEGREARVALFVVYGV